MNLARFLAALSLLCSTQSAFADVQCGNTADADVILMIDVSGSASAGEIAQQKAAALGLVNQFAGAVVKPMLAVGTFNTDCGGYSQCEDSGFDHARMVTTLSSNFAATIAQLQPGSGILGQGSGGAGVGGTKISRVLQVAHEHLLAHGRPAKPNYVIVFDEGNPTFPGYYTLTYPYFFPCPGTPDCAYWSSYGFSCPTPPNCCDNYLCPPAEAAGATASDQIGSGGSSIFTVHFGPTDFGGPAYLANSIASSPSYAYSLSGSLQGLFQTIAPPIICSDGIACTADICQAPGVCQYQESDSDGDGIGDCSDNCVGDNHLIGQACDGSDADPCASGTWGCGTGTLVCSDNPQLDDSDGDGVPNCQDSCSGDNGLIGQACDGSDSDPCASGMWECGSGTLLCTDNPQIDDTDGDGVPNCQDSCAGDDRLIGQACDGSDSDSCASGTWGCGSGTLLCSDNPQVDDWDGDGIPNCQDSCVGNDGLIGQACDGSDSDPCASGSWGCGTGTLLCSDNPQIDDSDGDGLPNCQDSCVGNNGLIGQACDGSDPDNCASGTWGCGTGTLLCSDNPQLDDTDGDGIPNCQDSCIGNDALIGQACDGSDADSCATGIYGCGSGTLACSDNAANDDADGDGVGDCVDGCPSDPGKSAAGICGCGVPDTDTDLDGTPNCNDQCPSDKGKVAPGYCGCGSPDTDSDLDGVPTCGDLCPDNPSKIAPGTCGCDVSDVDVNGDGVIDCTDLCPSDPKKATPGVCGCGIADVDSDKDGVIDCGSVTPTGSCSTTDIRGYSNALSTAAGSQNAQLSRLLRELSARSSRCPNPTRVKRFVKRSKKLLTTSVASNLIQVASLPISVQDCPDALGCTSVVVPLDASTYATESDEIKGTTLQAAKMVLQCKSGSGRCEGSQAECRRRATLRRQQYQRDRTQANSLHDDNLKNIKAIPATTDSCS